MPAPIPPFEAERLAALVGCELLDSASEPAFERITTLAAELFAVPIALVSLVDAQRQWFMSHHGLEARETPRDASFCAYTILSDEVLIVNDVTLDARFAGNPLVTGEPHIRFYAGAPLTREGQRIGSLCVIDTAPRPFTATDASLLKRLAGVVADAIEGRLVNRRMAGEIAARQRVETALQESEARFHRIADNVPGVIFRFTLSPDGRQGFSFVSEGARDFWRLAPEAICHDISVLLDLIHPEDRAAHDRSLVESARTLEPWIWEGRYVLASGETKWAQKDARAERLADGSTRWDGMVADITALKESAERLRLLESGIRHANDAVLITEAGTLDEPGPRIIYANAAFERMSGYPNAEVIGRSPRYLQGPNTTPESKRTIRRALEAWEPVRAEMINYRKDGGEFWVEMNIVPLEDERGRRTHFVSIQRDITARRQAQHALEHARDEANQANHAKSEFLSRMSHELRTPLNAILGFGQLLEMSELSRRQRDNVAHILKGGRHLLDLINEVLDIARIEAGKLELTLEPIRVQQAFEAAAALVRPMAAQRGVSLEIAAVSASDSVQADRQRLQQALLNLLSNAVKYNRRGGTVRLSCERDGGECLKLAVCDSGPGIGAEDLPKLFSPFERLGLQDGDAEGTGIGLAITKRLIEAMGGNVNVESAPGVGSTFRLELPVVSGHAGAGGEALTPVPPQGIGRKASTLLYVEDNISNYTLIELILEKRPEIRLLGAMQARIGLELAREHQPDLILLDLQLPDFCGDELLIQLKADERTRHIPVIMVSADATATQIKRLKSLGAEDYLTKPFNVANLLRTIEEALV